MLTRSPQGSSSLDFGVRHAFDELIVEERLLPASGRAETGAAAPHAAGARADVADGVLLVTLQGEADSGAAGQLRDLLTVAVTRHGRVVLDLAGVSFLDSAGLHALLASHRRAVLVGGRLVLATPSGPARRVLELAAVRDVLPVHDRLADALRAAEEPAYDCRPGARAVAAVPAGRRGGRPRDIRPPRPR
jgi:anti-anti-sigma factor